VVMKSLYNERHSVSSALVPVCEVSL